MNRFAALIKKDLMLFFRNSERFFSIALLSINLLVLTHFIFDANRDVYTTIGSYWIAFFFGSLLSIQKNQQLDQKNNCWEAIILAPISFPCIIFAKLFSNFIIVAVLQVFLATFFLSLSLSSSFTIFFTFISFILVATLSFSLLATLITTFTWKLPFYEILTPIIFFPLSIPLLLPCLGNQYKYFSTRTFYK